MKSPKREKRSPFDKINKDLIKAFGEITYEHYVPDDRIVWSGAYRKLLGYTKKEMGYDENSWLSRIHPDDLTAVKKEFVQAEREKRMYELEYRFRKKDRTYLWVLDRGVMSFNEKGKAEVVIGVMWDISHAKRIQAELDDVNEKLAKLNQIIEKDEKSD